VSYIENKPCFLRDETFFLYAILMTMKTLKCDLCDHEAQGETFESWMQALMPHYKETHADFMKQEGEKSEEEQKQGMQEWMMKNKARFDAT
jgi:hypothetical protein